MLIYGHLTLPSTEVRVKLEIKIFCVCHRLNTKFDFGYALRFTTIYAITNRPYLHHTLAMILAVGLGQNIGFTPGSIRSIENCKNVNFHFSRNSILEHKNCRRVSIVLKSNKTV